MKAIQKLIRQYGEHGNDYSPVEVGDTLNDVIDLLVEKGLVVLQEGVTPPPKPQPAPAKPQAVKKDDKGGYCVRCPSSGDKVYYILDGVKRWVRNLETLKKMGFDLHTVSHITNEEMDKFKTEEGIDLFKKPLEVTKPKDGPDIYNL